MAVEAHHLNLFPPLQLSNIRQMMNPIESSTNLYNTSTQMEYGMPLSTESTLLLPMYNNNSVITDSSKPTMINNNPLLSSSRKRTRESMINNHHPLLSSSTTPFSFLGHDISLQIQQQQFDIDHLISQHMEKVRIEIEERRKKQARKILEAIEESVMHKLRYKQEEIEKIGKINWALEERVKSLCIENQIWRDLAQTNEATANALRTNLEQVLLATTQQQQQDNNINQNGVVVLMDDDHDAQSCCGSNFDAHEDVEGKLKQGTTISSSSSRLCRNCKKEESCVLILPCRHLCLCTVCGSSLHICPVCNSSKNASVHVNMS
ncbi:hypothetical protein ACFE04_022212 [Oxalis oulophora]